MFAITHPSLPNYLALTGGSTFRISSDCTGCTVTATSLVDQLAAVDHYSTLQTIEDLLGLPRLRGAACVCTPSLEPLLAARSAYRGARDRSG